MPTAAVVVIGDEILSGKFPDENGPWLTLRLRALGCELRRLAVVSDRPEEIAEEVRRCSDRFDHVLTSGGIGPTHDDRTYEGVALALGVPLVEHPALVALLEAHRVRKDEASLRMTRVPAGASLEPGAIPTVRAGNVWILPGVPVLLRSRFEEVAGSFQGAPPRTARWVTEAREVEVAAALLRVAAAHPEVAIGSYPRFDEAGRERSLIVTLECRDPEALERAESALQGALPGGAWVEAGLHSNGRSR